MEYIASQVTEYIDILHIVLGGGCIFFRCYSSTLSKHILTSLLIKSFYSSKVVFLWEQRRKLIHGLFRRLYVESMYSVRLADDVCHQSTKSFQECNFVWSRLNCHLKKFLLNVKSNDVNNHLIFLAYMPSHYSKMIFFSRAHT
jgi:hypothetical protein